MTKSDTPLTDSASFPSAFFKERSSVVSSDLARRLERYLRLYHNACVTEADRREISEFLKG